jgi:hypothetical protein
MFKAMALLGGAALLGAFAVPAFAQGTPQTIVKVDVHKVATGYRASKLVGATVVNDANETVGKVDDLIVGPDGKAMFAILSVGGFLGMGDRLVAVPHDTLRYGKDKVVLAGGTKEQLKLLPEFKYARG